jgi:Fe2+ or Zn2+ uptake regulation protein
MGAGGRGYISRMTDVAPGSEFDRSVTSRLDADSQRYTSKRRALVELLAAADRPLTMPELVEMGDGLAQSSLYRNLSVLEAAGVVRRVVTENEFARFELAEDLTGHHHHHLVCSGCGSVEDVTFPDAFEQQLEGALESVAASSRFTVTAHRLDLVGLCSACADAARSN